ncbi:hypothetical protein CC2G_001591 [Coprinopsis cinerea AmutBmut pab1-1]|nr:hypothetical protein CC2G_001591 [Coprinopsis cinerea AmutBmut pab1-1]
MFTLICDLTSNLHISELAPANVYRHITFWFEYTVLPATSMLNFDSTAEALPGSTHQDRDRISVFLSSLLPALIHSQVMDPVTNAR